MDESDSTPVIPKPRKLALFKKPPSWARPVSSSSIDENAFSLSKHAYLRDQEEKARLKMGQASTKPVEVTSQREHVLHGERSRKRQRIDGDGSPSDESDNDYPASETSAKRHNTEPKRSITPATSLTTTPNPFIKSEIAKFTPLKPLREPIVINMCSSDDEEEEDEDTPALPSRKPVTEQEQEEDLQPQLPQRIQSPARSPAREPESEPLPPPEPLHKIQPDPDAEYEKILQESRERLKLEQARQKDAGPRSTQTNDYHPFGTTTQPIATLQPEPKVKLFLHSRIEKTKPLIVFITLTTKIRTIRDAWLARQQDLTPEEKSEIFFTWRGKRLFDFTTCKSLGINIDANGDLFISGSQSSELEDGQVEIEATTRKILESDQKTSQLETRGLSLKPDTPRSVPQDEATIRIVLKARGLDDFLLKVRPTTTFEQIARVFAMKRNVDPNSNVTLMFEGDKLDEKDTMQVSDVADMDIIEVHIR